MVGLGYAAHRQPDPRIAAAIVDALGPARSVLNVGAGAGSYEPTDRRVLAVEPSPEMIRQRPPGGAPVLQASATALPFRDGAFDATLAVLTVHHWPDRRRGLAELRRVARDRADGFLGAYWRRPEAYLDPAVRRAMSTFAKVGDVEPGVVRLRRDLEDGTWRRRHGALLARASLDLGYRLIIAW